MKPEPTDVGVIVGRFQVHSLHEGHRALIELVASRHRKVIVALGIPQSVCTNNNPLDFTSRQKMINSEYPSITVIPVSDRRSDEIWSAELDTRLLEIYPAGNFVLYGGRDSFISHYAGSIPLRVDLDALLPVSVSGSELRRRVSSEVLATPDWRAGVIYAATNRFPTSFPTVDVGIYDSNQARLALVQKPGEKGWRFVGGFVQPRDENLEMAVRRETYEEAGIDIGDIRYVFSHRVDDWRYRTENDKIITMLFAARYVSGGLKAGDDVAKTQWFDRRQVNAGTFVEEHRPLWEAFSNHLSETVW